MSHGRPVIEGGPLLTFPAYMRIYSPSTLSGRRFKAAWKEHELDRLLHPTCVATKDHLRKLKLTSFLPAAQRAWIAYSYHRAKKGPSKCTSSA